MILQPKHNTLLIYTVVHKLLYLGLKLNQEENNCIK